MQRKGVKGIGKEIVLKAKKKASWRKKVKLVIHQSTFSILINWQKQKLIQERGQASTIARSMCAPVCLVSVNQEINKATARKKRWK